MSDPNQGQGSRFEYLLACLPISMVLLVQLLADNKGDGRNQSVDHAVHWLAALFPYF